MGELKFRAWDIEKEAMTSVDSIDFITKEVTVTTKEGHSYQQSLDKVELMQFINAYDENKIDVYDGDILKTTEHTWESDNMYLEGLIERDEREIELEFNTVVSIVTEGLYTVGIETDGVGEYNTQELIDLIFWKETKVIGNIYENPELLEEEPFYK